MLYQFKCPEGHGIFEVRQSIWAEHITSCPECGIKAQRMFSRLEWIWEGSVFREDGSRREEKDYAPVMRG